MAATRSQSLIQWVSPSGGGNSPSWTCPAGYVTLVKSLYLHNPTGSTGQALMIANDQGVFAMIVAMAQLTSGAQGSWSGWIALNPGNTLYVNCNIGGVYFWVSGAVLSGPNQFPIAGG